MTTINADAPLDSFERVYDAVRKWVIACSALTDVTWSHEKQGHIHPVQKARVELKEMSMVDKGSDELRRVYDEDQDIQTVSQVGNRILTVQIKIQSLQARPTAFTIMERLRSRTQGSRRSHSKELRDENISIQMLGKSTPMPTTYDTRVASCCVAELILNVAAIVPAVEEDFVDRVEFDGDIT